ncbi:DsbC family protein [Acinetobacter ursingii]|uniref:DsbC family protein n=1 Tax=Acinetobacter ursingii TaxID=108980 RepID=UPI00124F0A8F|nr:DsbC family protein [Acinetobacter ursingii]
MKFLFSALTLSLFSISLSHANIATVQQNLKKNFPDIPVQSVQTTPLKDIYEVYMGGQIVYTNDDANYFFIGNLIDNKNQKNLTEDSLQKLEKIDVSTLPLDQAIKHVKGNGQRVLYLFSDPDCPYCQRLEKQMASIDNVTIYLFLYPLKGLHPNAENMATKIWCAKDQYAAWENYLLNKKQPTKAASCQTPIQKNLELGKRLKISGTPTMFLKNGNRITGAMEADELNQLLDKTK